MEQTSVLTQTARWWRPSAAPGGGQGRVVLVQLLTALALSTAGGAAIAATGDWRIATGLLGGMAFAAFGMLRPALFLGVLLAVRPLLDGLPGGVGGLTGIVLISVCAIAVATSRQTIALRGSIAFGALLAVSALASLLAMLELRDALGLDPLAELVRLAALFAIYVLAAHIATSPARMRSVFLVVGLSGVLPALSGLAELLNDPEKIASLDLVRVSGTFVNPVALSAYLALCILVLVSLPREDLPAKVRWPAAALMLVALIATYGREGWALLLLGIVVLHWRSSKRVLVAMATVCATLLLVVPGVRERVLPTEEVTQSDAASTFASYDFRLANWRGLLNRYAERPLTGWGLESTVAVNPRRPYGALRDSAGGFQAHNAVVRALVEGGVQLLLAVLAVFAVMIAAMRRIARAPQSPLRPYARIAAAAWIAVLVVAVTTDDVLDATALVYALLALTAVVEGAHHALSPREPRMPPAAHVRSAPT